MADHYDRKENDTSLAAFALDACAVAVLALAAAACALAAAALALDAAALALAAAACALAHQYCSAHQKEHYHSGEIEASRSARRRS